MFTLLQDSVWKRSRRVRDVSQGCNHTFADIKRSQEERMLWSIIMRERVCEATIPALIYTNQIEGGVTHLPWTCTLLIVVHPSDLSSTLAIAAPVRSSGPLCGVSCPFVYFLRNKFVAFLYVNIGLLLRASLLSCVLHTFGISMC